MTKIHSESKIFAVKKIDFRASIGKNSNPHFIEWRPVLVKININIIKWQHIS